MNLIPNPLKKLFCDEETVFLDVGAAYRCMSLLAAVSGGAVYSYEPNPLVFKGLTKNALLNKSIVSPIQLFNKAVSSKSVF